jgi:hypothetical protein
MGSVGGGVRRTAGVRLLAAVVAFAVGGGLLLREWETTSGFLFGAYLGVVMAHFVLDAGMWRLSEPFQRRYMAERFSFLR